VRLSRRRFDAIVFDLDGVITDTARVHAAAWKDLFDGLLTGHAGQGPFEDADYLRYVDGKPRYDGVASFLASRNIELPWGTAEDGPGTATVCGLGNEKDVRFRDRLATGGVHAFPGSVALVDAARQAGLLVAVVSASRNCRAVLDAAGLTDRFDVRIDGADADELGLAGKPDPAIFLEATARLDVAPRRTVLVEDALVGVEAGRRGGFGLVVGVDRHGRRADLAAAGADAVVGDLAEVTVGP
jgi:alpha,alpha-trehalase